MYIHIKYIYIYIQHKLINVINRAIGVCCPDEVTEKAGASIINLPQTGSDIDEAPVWSNDNDPERNVEPIIEKPEERGTVKIKCFINFQTLHIYLKYLYQDVVWQQNRFQK